MNDYFFIDHQFHLSQSCDEDIKIKIINPLSLIRQRAMKPGNNELEPRKFGAFSGVFTPDVLTILGVIMYLRLGWVVGNAGFFGAVAILLLAKSITLCTALSMSSITTNIRIGSGGAYSIITKSLGIEAGGSIGLPFYISQTLSAAFYIIGFTEAWSLVFPEHPKLIVASASWFVLLVVTYVSAHLAIKVQFIIMAIIGVSLISFFLSPIRVDMEIVKIGQFQDATFWGVFAIFFPAVTGIMAGANMSGDLKDPRRAIPIGTLSAIGVTFIIYLALAYFLSVVATPEELRSNQMIMIDKAFWGPAVIAGLIGATLSSALGSMVGAPRILQALADQKTVPFSKTLAKKTKSNEPRNAILVTGIAIEVALIFGSLNFLATLITMFFLITYGMINLVVFIENAMKIISFRPTFKIPNFIPLFGAIGCIFIMFLINAVFSIIALVTIVAIYLWLARRGLGSDSGDIRGGMFLTLAERVLKLSQKYPKYQVSWKPDLLIPIENPKSWSGPLLFIENVTSSSGSILAFTVTDDCIQESEKDLEELFSPLKKDILISHTVIQDNEFLHGARVVIQTLKASSFRPNILFLTLGSNEEKDQIIKNLVLEAHRNKMGSIVLRMHPGVAFGMQRDVNVWIRDKSPNWNLGILIALKLQLSWEGKINLVTVSEDRNERQRLYRYLENLSDQARLPSMTELHVIISSFDEAFKLAPRADINIFGLPFELQFEFMRSSSDLAHSSCIFVKDSGYESALV